MARTVSEDKCLVCGGREWGWICPKCGAAGWTDKRLMQLLVDFVRAPKNG